VPRSAATVPKFNTTNFSRDLLPSLSARQENHAVAATRPPHIARRVSTIMSSGLFPSKPFSSEPKHFTRICRSRWYVLYTIKTRDSLRSSPGTPTSELRRAKDSLRRGFELCCWTRPPPHNSSTCIYSESDHHQIFTSLICGHRLKGRRRTNETYIKILREDFHASWRCGCCSQKPLIPSQRSTTCFAPSRSDHDLETMALHGEEWRGEAACHGRWA
jgi:hypothetical protein